MRAIPDQLLRGEPFKNFGFWVIWIAIPNPDVLLASIQKDAGEICASHGRQVPDFYGYGIGA
jgi:hypothetical protein